VRIHERTPAHDVAGGQVTCAAGTVRAEMVVRATESYTVRLPGRRRAFLPVYSHMLATEPLPDEAWEQIGWSGCEPVADQHHLFAYAQRTVDGRIAMGGRGAPYRAGSVIREADERRPAIHTRIERTLRVVPRRGRRGDHAPLGRPAGDPARLAHGHRLRSRGRAGVGRRPERAWVVASHLCGRTLAP
jgi:hypothetical protein